MYSLGTEICYKYYRSLALRLNANFSMYFSVDSYTGAETSIKQHKNTPRGVLQVTVMFSLSWMCLSGFSAISQNSVIEVVFCII
ncbi:hypothetical protein YC2023_013073 [Brassica napus]